MKIGKIDQNIIKHGKYKNPEYDLVLQSNICPECGNDLKSEYRSNYVISDTCKETLMYSYIGKRVTFTCPECFCEWERVVYTNKKCKLSKIFKNNVDEDCIPIITSILLILSIILIIIGCCIDIILLGIAGLVLFFFTAMIMIIYSICDNNKDD